MARTLPKSKFSDTRHGLRMPPGLPEDKQSQARSHALLERAIHIQVIWNFLYRRLVPHILVGFNSLFWGIWEAVLWLQESANPFLQIAFYEESPILVSRLLPGPVFLKI